MCFWRQEDVRNNITDPRLQRNAFSELQISTVILFSILRRDALPEFLDFFLDTLTSKNKEHGFEGFAGRWFGLEFALISSFRLVQRGGIRATTPRLFRLIPGLMKLAFPAWKA